MNITEYAIAKKLFGGGKRTGTAIKAGEIAERIYFNIHNSVEETNAILSQLTYIQTPLSEVPLYPVYANTNDGDYGSFIFICKLPAFGEPPYDNEYQIVEILSVSQGYSASYYGVSVTEHGVYNGWGCFVKHDGLIPDEYVLPMGIQLYTKGYSLTDFSGLPIGAENEKIKNVLSTTPF